MSQNNHTPPPVQDKLEGQQFFDLMQQYRTADMLNQSRVIETFENVKKFVRSIITGYDSLHAENEKVKRLLHDLTPGGSEFYNDPEYCAKWIRESREENHYSLARQIKEAKAENERLREVNKELVKELRQFIHSVEHEGEVHGRIAGSVETAKELIAKATGK